MDRSAPGLQTRIEFDVEAFEQRLDRSVAGRETAEDVRLAPAAIAASALT